MITDYTFLTIFHRTSWSSGWYYCFVFGRSRFQISARRPAILTDYLSWISSDPTGECPKKTLKIKLWPLPSKSFPIHHSLITLSNASLNKLQIKLTTSLSINQLQLKTKPRVLSMKHKLTQEMGSILLNSSKQKQNLHILCRHTGAATPYYGFSNSGHVFLQLITARNGITFFEDGNIHIQKYQTYSTLS
jgi:hypothetical protein